MPNGPFFYFLISYVLYVYTNFIWSLEIGETGHHFEKFTLQIAIRESRPDTGFAHNF